MVIVTLQGLYSMFAGSGYHLRPWLDVLVVALVALAVWSWRRERHWAVFCLVLALVLPVGQLALSPARPVFHARSHIWVSTAACSGPRASSSMPSRAEADWRDATRTVS